MIRRRKACVPLLVPVLASLFAGCGPAEAPPDETLWHHRNLGKAFYENPATQYKAVAEFKAALDLYPDSARERVNHGLSLIRAGQVEEGVAELERAQQQDPSIPHTWFNLGLAYKNDSRHEEATRQFERMVELVPDEPKAHYNLGVLYKLNGKGDAALKHFERAAELAPTLAGPHFQMATAYRQAGRVEDAQRETQLFRELKKRETEAAIPEDLEWSPFVEIYDTIDPLPPPTAPAEAVFASAELARLASPGALAVLDADADGRPDLVVGAAAELRLFAGGAAPGTVVPGDFRDVRDLAPADFDNDGRTDLCVVGADVRLFRNGEDGFAGGEPVAGGGFRAAVWLDYDHDYDLDLFLLGESSRLLRNAGPAGFEDRTGDFPFRDAPARAGAAIDVEADADGKDLVVAYEGGNGVIYRDRLGGRYVAVELGALPPGVDALAVADADNDGSMDLAYSGSGGTGLLLNDGAWGFAPVSISAPSGAPAWADVDNRGIRDLFAGNALLRNEGRGRFEPGPARDGATVTARAVADFDGDGLVDVAELDADGILTLRANRSAAGHAWLRVELTGVKNLQLTPGAEVEVKAGSSYQKAVYPGYPLLFGVGSHAAVDTVRITWPNGLVQNEPQQDTGQLVAYKEAARLSGSCPMIFTWDGREFRFIADVLGVAPLGASAGDGSYFPVDHDEYVQLPPGALVPRDGRYEVRVTEELAEVAYIDEVRLVAVDHPADVALYTNDKFKSPPFPEFALFGVTRPVHPVAARDDAGRDVRERLLAADRRYVDGFERDFAGVAELHRLELDFGAAAPDGDAALVLNGWLDWADGSTFLRMAQESPAGLVMPYLQVIDESGEWRTAIADMGMPAGKSKTIVVDLDGVFPTADRRVRIVTNLVLYWDEIVLAERPLRWADPAAERSAGPLRLTARSSRGPAEVVLTRLEPARAELDFRGFSRVVLHPERLQPEAFVYADREFVSNWNPTPGRYTRFGDVRPLVTAIDDRMVVMGSGDELSLSFDATGLPDLPAGRARSFLLFFDGWAKDGDANTAFSQTVDPLPYHGMPGYPYEAPHAYPGDELRTLYREHYLSREPLRLLRPLIERPRRPISTHEVGP